MRGFLSIIILIFLILSCSRVPQPPVSKEGTRTIPVFEVFGYARCQNCPIVEHAADSLKKLYGDSIAVLEYHLRLLGDTLSPEEISIKTALYGVGTSAPVTFIQGVHRIDGAEANDSTQIVRLDSYYKSLRLLEDSILLNLTVDTLGDTVLLTFSADSSFYIDTLNTVLFIVVTEDSIFFALSGAEDSVYNNVVRKIISLPSILPQNIPLAKEYLEGKTVIGMIQDTIGKNILSITQRRF